MEAIRVLIVDDHPLIRQGLSKVLELEDGIAVIGEAPNGGEALELARKLKPDVVLMDVNMPGMGGIEATARIRGDMPNTKVLILTIHDDDGYVMQTMRGGAAGYLLKDVEPRNLVDAIKIVHKGGSYIHPTIAAKLMGEINRLSTGGKPPNAVQALTRREVDVLRCLARGCSNRDIANELFISEKTVKNHISSIFHKLNVSDRTQALIKGLKMNLVNLE